MSIQASLFYGKTFKHLSQAVQAFENYEGAAVVDAVIIPPTADYNTDEEEIDSEQLNENLMPNDVPGQVELFVNDFDFESEDDEPLSSLKKRKTSVECPVIWSDKQCDISMSYTSFHCKKKEAMKAALNGKNCIEIFETLFDQDVYIHIIEQTEIYARQKNNHSFKISCEEFKTFIGILFYTGYHSMPRETMYWQLDEDTRTSIICNNMSKNRFLEIKRHIHLADNAQIDKSDKMAKIRPLMKLICQKFQQWGYMHENLSIDEAMVRYFGSHSSKQFIKGKPVRFGFKNWMLTSSCGYLYSFDTYCGAKNVDSHQKNIPLGSRVVLELLATVDIPSDHAVYFDNFFTSHDLLCKLRQKGFRATGTTRVNRTGKCTLNQKEVCKKKERGYYDIRYDAKNKISFVQWNDNNVVTMGTNFDDIRPMQYVKRWCTKTKKKIAYSNQI